MKDSNKLLSAKQLAEVVGVSEITVRRWRREGRIPCAMLIAKSHRYRLSDVLDALGQPARVSAVSKAG